MDRIHWLLVFLLFISLAVIVLLLVLYRKREKDTAELISYLMRVQDRLELPEMSGFREGQFGILQSEIYKLVALLKEQYSKEKKQKKYMADMLSDISHQIKTPMTAITIMNDLLKTPELSERQRLAYVEKIDSQTERIRWLVKNLLTMSRLEADMLELKKEEICLRKMLDTIVDTFEIMAEVKGVDLRLECPEEIYHGCDKQWTREAISNIVKNCIEHTTEGGSGRISVLQPNLATEISIQDTGEGIPKEHLPYIFKRFYKAPGSSNSSVGIGLSMSKQIIMRQNGNITVESEVGKGSAFSFVLQSSNGKPNQRTNLPPFYAQ